MKSKQQKRRKQAENRFQMKKSSISSSSSSSSSLSTSFQHKEIEGEEEEGVIPSHINNAVNNNLPGKKITQQNLKMKHIPKWNVSATVDWLKHIGYEDCGVHFRDHRINGRALLMLGEDDLKEIIKHNVGQRKNLYHLIRLLQIKYNRYMNKLNSSFFSNSGDEEEEEEENVNDSDENETENNGNHLNEKDLPKTEKKLLNGYIKSNQSKQISYDDGKRNTENASLIHNHLINETQKDLNEDTSSGDQESSNMNRCNFENQSNFIFKINLKI